MPDLNAMRPMSSLTTNFREFFRLVLPLLFTNTVRFFKSVRLSSVCMTHGRMC
jgi:hypothetical protein